MHHTDASQPSELSSEKSSGTNTAIRTAMSYGNGGAELAILPVLFGLVGYFVDSALDIRPILTIIGALIGLGGSCFNQYFRYTQRMAKLTAARKAAHVAEYGTGSVPSFGMNEPVDLPSYVLPSEVDVSPELKSENA